MQLAILFIFLSAERRASRLLGKHDGWRASGCGSQDRLFKSPARSTRPISKRLVKSRISADTALDFQNATNVCLQAAPHRKIELSWMRGRNRARTAVRSYLNQCRRRVDMTWASRRWGLAPTGICVAHSTTSSRPVIRAISPVLTCQLAETTFSTSILNSEHARPDVSRNRQEDLNTVNASENAL